MCSENNKTQERRQRCSALRQYLTTESRLLLQSAPFLTLFLLTLNIFNTLICYSIHLFNTLIHELIVRFDHVIAG